MLRLEGRLFFLNAERIAEKIRAVMQEAQPKVVVIDLSGVFDIEYSALKMLIEAEERSREGNVALWLAAATPEVLTTIRHSSLDAALGRERLFFNLEIAVDKYRAQMTQRLAS